MGLISGKVASMILAGTLATGSVVGLVSVTYDGGDALKTVRLWMMDESSKVQAFDKAEGKLLDKISALKSAASDKIGEANDLIAGKNTVIRDKNQTIEELREEINGYLEQIESLEAQIDELTGDKEQLREELNSALADLELIRSQLAQANEQIAKLQEEIESLTAENDRLNQELEKANGEIEKANDDAAATEAFIYQIKTDKHNPLSDEEIEEVDITLPEIVDEDGAE